MYQPLIFDIARGSSVDGPGLRTVVFLKGCPLRCSWCQNPESQLQESETFFYAERCIKCGNCRNGCNSLAKVETGKYYPEKKIVKYILRDKIFYDSTSGGVTFSGGEPLMYLDYLFGVFSGLKNSNIHIAVDTCGFFDYKKAEKKIFRFIDLFLFDLKIIDQEKHKKYTGKSNDVILKNLKKLIDNGHNIRIRIPLVPKITATEKNLSEIADLMIKLNIKDYSFLPYNSSGPDKLRSLGKAVPDDYILEPMGISEEKRLEKFFREKLF